jgi:hypothetical protein
MAGAILSYPQRPAALAGVFAPARASLASQMQVSVRKRNSRVIKNSSNGKKLFQPVHLPHVCAGDAQPYPQQLWIRREPAFMPAGQRHFALPNRHPDR